MRRTPGHGAHDVRRAIGGAVVHDDQLEAGDADLTKGRFNGKHTRHDRVDAIFFVQGRNDYGQGGHRHASRLAWLSMARIAMG